MLAWLLLLLAAETPKLAPCDAVKIGYDKALDAYPSQDRGLVQAFRFSRADSWDGAWTVVTVYRRNRPREVRARVDFTGDFGHEIGLLEIVADPAGLIVRIYANLE